MCKYIYTLTLNIYIYTHNYLYVSIIIHIYNYIYNIRIYTHTELHNMYLHASWYVLLEVKLWYKPRACVFTSEAKRAPNARGASRMPSLSQKKLGWNPQRAEGDGPEGRALAPPAHKGTTCTMRRCRMSLPWSILGNLKLEISRMGMATENASCD